MYRRSPCRVSTHCDCNGTPMTEPRNINASISARNGTPGRVALLLGLLLVAGVAGAENIPRDVLDTAGTLRDRAVAGTDAYDILAGLTHEVGARLAGSDGDRRAVAWAAATLEARGFANVRAEPVRVPRWQRGTLQVTLPGIDTRPLVAVALGGSVGTPDGGVTGTLLRVSSLAELTALDEGAVRGRIVFIDQRMERTRSGRGYGATVPNRVRGASVAAERGAAALVIRSVGTSSARIAHTGTMIYKPGVERIPAVALAHADADRVAWLLRKRGSVTMHIDSTSRSLDSVLSANVIGEIPGTDPAAGIIVLGAHLDSWDLGTGALDDGAGVAIVISAAEQIARARPRSRHTVRVVLYANEEYGLSGAAQYMTDHADEVDRHILALESDFGAGRIWRLSTQVADEALPVIDTIMEVLAPLGIERGDNKASGGADIGRLRTAGVPVFALNQDGTDYFDYHHTQDDTLDKVERTALDQNVAAMAAAVYVVAASGVDLGRLTGSN